MTKLKKMFPFLAIVIGIGLATGTSAFKSAGDKKLTDFYWVLKTGTTATTNETDYKQGTSSCNSQIHFCGFTAPKDGSVDKPLIPNPSSLYTDLNNLNGNPNNHYNTSAKVDFKDAE